MQSDLHRSRKQKCIKVIFKTANHKLRDSNQEPEHLRFQTFNVGYEIIILETLLWFLKLASDDFCINESKVKAENVKRSTYFPNLLET